MVRSELNRRQFLRATGGIAAGIALAGCSAGTAPSEFDASMRVVNDAPAPLNETEDHASPDVTPTKSEALGVDEVVFERAGPKGVLVAGDVTNDGDQRFEGILVEVTLYDSKEREDDILDSVTNQTRHDGLDAGDTWQWAVKFTDDPAFETAYYSVTVKGRYA